MQHNCHLFPYLLFRFINMGLLPSVFFFLSLSLSLSKYKHASFSSNQALSIYLSVSLYYYIHDYNQGKAHPNYTTTQSDVVFSLLLVLFTSSMSTQNSHTLVSLTRLYNIVYKYKPSRSIPMTFS
jgi:uncharacterized membrane protein